MSLWVVRVFFLTLCILGGYAVSQVRPDVIENGAIAGVVIGFGMGGLLIGIDVMLKGFSLRAFSAATFGLFLGTLTAWMIDGTKEAIISMACSYDCSVTLIVSQDKRVQAMDRYGTIH